MAAAGPAQSDIEWATPVLEARWRQLQQLIQQNMDKERRLQEQAARYGAQVGLDPSSIALLRFQALLELIWPADTAEGQDMRLRHDELVQEQVSRNLDALAQQLGQQLLAMRSQMPAAEMADLLSGKAPQQPPAGLARSGGPERRSRAPG
jgi:hypothetical protein